MLRLAMLLLLTTACDDKGGSSDDTGPALASTSGPDHCGSITTDDVWAADLNPHPESCHVEIDGGSLAIQAGERRTARLRVQHLRPVRGHRPRGRQQDRG